MQTIKLKQQTRRLNADLETPISLFLSITEGEAPAILLESAEVDGKWGRYSIIACDFLMTAHCRKGTLQLDICDDRLESLSELNGAPFVQGLKGLMKLLELECDDKKLAPITRALYGYFGYEMAALFQPKLAHTLNTDDAESCLCLPGTILLFDHLYNHLTQLSLREHRDIPARHEFSSQAPVSSAATYSPDEEGYKKSVDQVRTLLHDGEAIQVVLSSQASAEFSGDPFILYRRMRSINPSPYMFFMRLPGICLFGSSPEVLVRCTDGKLQLSPIAGTRKRGDDEVQDAQLASELLEDPKERAEHIMLVDLGRNDLGCIAKPGSVKVERLMEVERFSHVMHLTSRVTAQLNPGLDALDILSASFPAGTVSGAPKVRAMEIIAGMESKPRGPYAGCIGWLGLDKDSVHMDSGITIRSMWGRAGRIHWQTGAGLVYDSNPAAEWQECLNKGKIIEVILKGEDHVSINR